MICKYNKNKNQQNKNQQNKTKKYSKYYFLEFCILKALIDLIC